MNPEDYYSEVHLMMDSEGNMGVFSTEDLDKETVRMMLEVALEGLDANFPESPEGYVQ